MTAALLTLADSRLPAGGHTHSGGVEQAVAAGLVHDPSSLAVFLLRRLTTSGAVAAGLAAVSSGGRQCRGRGRRQTRGDPAGGLESAEQEGRQRRRAVHQPRCDRLLDAAGVRVPAGRQPRVGQGQQRRRHQKRK